MEDAIRNGRRIAVTVRDLVVAGRSYRRILTPEQDAKICRPYQGRGSVYEVWQSAAGRADIQAALPRLKPLCAAEVLRFRFLLLLVLPRKSASPKGAAEHQRTNDVRLPLRTYAVPNNSW